MFIAVSTIKLFYLVPLTDSTNSTDSTRELYEDVLLLLICIELTLLTFFCNPFFVKYILIEPTTRFQPDAI